MQETNEIVQDIVSSKSSSKLIYHRTRVSLNYYFIPSLSFNMINAVKSFHEYTVSTVKISLKFRMNFKLSWTTVAAKARTLNAVKNFISYNFNLSCAMSKTVWRPVRTNWRKRRRIIFQTAMRLSGWDLARRKWSNP